MPKVRKTVIIVLLVMVLLFLGSALIKIPPAGHVTWGVNFSKTQAENLHLDWKAAYTTILKDLGVRQVKMLTRWDLVESKQNNFDFQDIDWQLDEAKAHGASVMYVVGMKTGRWPECHVPGWASNLSKEQQQEEILEYVRYTVERYRDNPIISAWQAENEPLFRFGKCPWYDREFLKKEVALIKSLDSHRLVIISDTGENSLWFTAADIGDKVSSTMYRKVWMHIADSLGLYFTWPLPAWTYSARAALVQIIFHKEVFVGELQAEPWNSKLFYDNVPLKEQEKSMNLRQLKENVGYARATGFDAFYFWGVEWWYWLKETQNKPEIWDYAKTIFSNP